MVSTNWLFPTNAVAMADEYNGLLYRNASYADRVRAEDGAYAEIRRGANNQFEDAPIRVFGFPLSTIPTGATITGFEMRISCYANPPGPYDSQPTDNIVRPLIHSGRETYSNINTGAQIGAADQIGQNLASSKIWPTLGAQYKEFRVYGGPTNMWGVTEAQLRNPNFGFDLRMNGGGKSAAVGYIDSFQLRVHYEGGPPPQPDPVVGSGSGSFIKPSATGSAKHGVKGSATGSLPKLEGEAIAIMVPAQGAATRTPLTLASFTARSAYDGDYARARSGEFAVAGEYPWVGQYLNGSTYEVNQTIVTFDTSTLDDGEIMASALVLEVAENYGDNIVEVRVVPADAFVPGAELASYPLFATKTINTAGSHIFYGLQPLPRQSAFKLAITTFDQRRGIAPTEDDTFITSNISLVVDIAQATSGIGVATLLPLTATGAATHGVKGSGSGHLTPIIATGSGKIATKGSGSGSLGRLTGTGVGVSTPPMVTGVGSGSLGAISANGSVKHGATGLGAGQLAVVAGEAVGSSTPPATSGVGSYTFPTLIAGGLAKHGVKGSGAGVLTVVGEGSGVSTPPVNVGVGAGVMRPLDGTGSGVTVTAGDAPLTVLPGLSGEGSGVHGARGAGDGSLGGLTASGLAGLVPGGQGVGTLLPVTAEGVGVHLTGAYGVGVLSGLSAAGEGVHGLKGQADGSLPSLTGSSTGNQGVRGSGSIYLATLNGVAVARHGVTGHGEGSLPAIAGEGRGSSVTGSGAADLAPLSGSGVSGHGVRGEGSGELGLIGSGLASHGVAGSGEGVLTLIGSGEGAHGATGVGEGVMPVLTGIGRDAEAIGNGGGVLSRLEGQAKGFFVAANYAGVAGRKISFDVRTGRITVDATGGEATVDALGGKLSVDASGGKVAFDEMSRVIRVAA